MAKPKIPDFELMAKELFKDMPDLVAIHALNFFKESFYKQGFTDNSFEKWQDRKVADSRAILTQTTNLRESMRIIQSDSTKIEIGTSLPYAQIHNDGGVISIQVTPKSRRYFWFMFKATKKPMWRAMALTKKDRLSIKMPKRQFIGDSQALNGQIDSMIANQIIRALKTAK